ncbi:mannose-1-phosphate guanylyltransferase [Paenibacillus koleovorans]|uniref:mannose-1-phosphate guanylyltransferase n=1 Tax=Paenibacillus koleovorans TaxID=121608 RepID=UPI000FD8BC74|nr:sugar phosphate nucleotidyltransferase [Paenibacillus koleovorans]
MKIVIMAGGIGTRFWPRSVPSRPKQFLALTSEETMIQETYRRFTRWLPRTSVYVITAAMYKTILQQQLPELPESQLLLEPEQRDTGPCIGLTARHFLELGDDEVIVTTPSDQYIPDGRALMQALRRAEQAAAEPGTIVTLGITPTRPETAFGYIQAKEDSDCGRGLLRVHAFMEKPSRSKAESLVLQKHVYWNSGICIWKPSTIAYYMQKHQIDTWNALTLQEEEMQQAYARLPKVSVDYAILEKAEKIFTIPVQFEWDDVGMWTSLDRIHPHDEDGNIVQGSGSTYPFSAKTNILYIEQGKAVVIGVEDLIIVSTSDGLLVCHKSQEQQIKHVLKAIEQSERG